MAGEGAGGESGLINESERWRTAKEIFELAAEQPAEARREFVKSKTDDEIVLNEVLGLLKGLDSANFDFEAGAVALVGRDPDTDAALPDRIGPYRVIRQVGEGGMGTVYEAMRDDDQYRMRVAVKVIRGSFHSNSVERRFRRERQILATLAHPNIASLLDGGITSDSRPYLVMEFVEGYAIDRYCDDNQLSVRSRIELFARVCRAVDHAHRNLVVHRDIKPGNVLVTSGGVPKLLDFGIAKLIKSELDTDEETVTAAGLSFFTPDFASPEQLRLEPVSILSDVYSLGAVLYVLLAGRKPFASRKTSTNTDAEPARPSLQASDAAASARGESDAIHLRHRLAGELDNIVLTAMRSEPARRYQSARDLADDLDRFLLGLPVKAQKDSALYRAKKFVMRHRVAVAGSAVVVASLVGGVAATLWQARIARAAAASANRERAKAEQITGFLQGIIGSADPSWYSAGERPGPNTTVLEAIQVASKRISQDLGGQPDVEASMRRTIGNTYQALGLPDSAEPQLRAAIALNRRAGTKPSLELARDLRDLGVTRFQRGYFSGARDLLTEAVSVRKQLGDTSSVELATALNDLSVMQARLGHLGEAETTLARSVALTKTHFGEAHAAYAGALGNLAALRNERGDLPGAERYLRASLQSYKAAGGREYFERGIALMNLASILKWDGRYVEADSVLSEAARVIDHTVGQGHPAAAQVLLQQAYTHVLAGQTSEAMKEIEKGITIFKAAGYADNHPERARAQTIEGLVLAAAGQTQRSEQVLRHSLALRQKTFTDPDIHLAETEAILALTLRHEGKSSESHTLFVKATSAMNRLLGAKDARTQMFLRWQNGFEPFSPGLTR